MSNKIVLIDDDPEDIEIMLEVLQDLSPSSSTLTFTDPCYAIDVLKDMNPSVLPDYIILDIQMPTLSGLECLQQLRALEKLNHISFLIHSTAEPTPKIIEDFKQLGAEIYQKPSTIADFETYFKKFLKNKADL